MRTLFGYIAEMDGYTNSSSDIPKLYAIADNGMEVINHDA